MTYAKAFMKKVLDSDLNDQNSFANKLTDKRYADFVASYNFEKYGELATSYNRTQHDVPTNSATQRTAWFSSRSAARAVTATLTS